jgi:hypothetical protein
VTTATDVGTGVNFGFTQRGAVSGGVFVDANGNGQWDVGEPPAAATQTVNLTRLDGSGGASKSTQADGAFRFPGLTPGQYVLRLFPSTGWSQTSPEAAAGRLVTVTAAGQVLGIDFGIRQFAPATVTGTAFEDLNGDGVRQAADKPLSARLAYVDDNGNGRFDPTELATMANSTGTFALTGLAPGTYTIRLDDRGGWAQTTPAGGFTVTVAAGQTVPLAGAFGSHKVDVTPPQASGDSFDPTTGAVRVRFDEPITGLTSSDARVTAIPSNAAVAYTLLGYDQTTGIATFLPSQGVSLAPGTYRIRLLAGSVNDVAGNPLAADFQYDFVVPPPTGAAVTSATPPARRAPIKKVPIAKPLFNTAVPIKRPSPTSPPARMPSKERIPGTSTGPTSF